MPFPTTPTGRKRADNDFLELVAQSHALNSKIFSLVRLQLLASLAALGPDGATYRELKAALGLSDGALFANLKALLLMGYIKSGKISLEGKNLESFRITADGLEQWVRTKEWLCRFLECGGAKNG